SAEVSRGDQILNAESFERQGFAFLIREEELTNETLLSGVNQVLENRDSYIAAMKSSTQTDAAETIVRLMKEVMAGPAE
ncbi:MAG: UDP-N-acetylglucosamine--N-acetylmuramyl-(pentapeptide) pyrophosphoryl-undecaprenol N-acetylglucosamine transferase, partial [Lachnospiraceae bacterium]|nr:UDP-N-acetylglucosamine--N-acetylmuramyl-(pentapeptide) pyrophosphoryl-undecaprenol N-acetylglucosamine transferase [Lachnospiraceae bacterium]